MEIQLKVDTNRLTFGDLLALEDAQDGKRPFRTMATVISRFIVDAEGNYLTSEQALEIMKPLTINQINELATAFGEAVQVSQKAAIPPAKGGS